MKKLVILLVLAIVIPSNISAAEMPPYLREEALPTLAFSELTLPPPTSAKVRSSADFLAITEAADPNATPIYTAADLCKMADSNGSFVLMNDIDLSEIESWNPISNFSGIFDGQEYTISNMKSIASKNSNRYYAGLFSSIGSGTVIKNLQMADAEIDLTYTYGDNHYAGTIAGYASDDAVFENCVAFCNTDAKTMKITSRPSYSKYVYAYAGGIIGYADGTIQISNCDFYGIIDLQVTAAPGRPYVYAGGIVGYAYSPRLDNCFSYGAVRAIASGQESSPSYTADSYAYAGGMVGYTGASTFTGCLNQADIYTESYAFYGSNRITLNFSGGIAGRVTGDSTFTDCYNYANIDGLAQITQTGDSTSESLCGGIIGSAFARLNGTFSAAIKNCESYGGVNAAAQGSNNAWAGSGTMIGGITNNYNVAPNKGFAKLTIEDCIGAGYSAAQSYSYYQSRSFSGGLAGMMQSWSAGVDLTVKNSKHTGDIVSVIAYESATQKYPYRGGIVGSLSGNSGNVVFEPYCYYSQTDLNPIGNRSDDINVAGTENVNPATVTISFNSNGGSPVPSVEVVLGESIDAPIDPTRTGYYFDGWYAEEGLINKVEFPYTVTGTATFFVKWEAACTVSFNTNGGAALPVIYVKQGDTIDAPPDTTKEGYYLEGWYAEEGLVNKIEFPYTVADNTTLHAKWENNEILVCEIDAKNLSEQGVKASRLAVYKIREGSDFSYKLVMNFQELAQNVSLHTASYDTKGKLTDLLTASSGSMIVNKLELNNIPKEMFDGAFKILLWGKDMNTFIVPITSFE